MLILESVEDPKRNKFFSSRTIKGFHEPRLLLREQISPLPNKSSLTQGLFKLLDMHQKMHDIKHDTNLLNLLQYKYKLIQTQKVYFHKGTKVAK